MKRLLSVATGLAVAGLIGVGLLFLSRVWHPEFGLIRSTQMAEKYSPSSFKHLVLNFPEVVLRIFNDPPPPFRQREYLLVGSAQLEWSLMSTGLKSGWLYFTQPESHAFIWEFAPCAKTSLADVGAGDLDQAQFVRGQEISRIKMAFNSDSWVETKARVTPGGNVIPVREGQIILARLIDTPNSIYVLKLKNQFGSDSWGGIQVEYVQFETRPHEQDRRANENP